jgi:hypothetical protein
VGAPAGRRLPFELHRVAELLVGVALVSFSLHVSGSFAALGAGLVVIVPALVTRGRLGVLRWCSTRVHRLLDVGLVVLLALLPLVPGSGGASLAMVTGPAAAVLALLLVRTDYRPREPSAPIPRTPPPGPPPPPPPPSGSPLTDRAARRLGRLAGILERSARAAVDRERR